MVIFLVYFIRPPVPPAGVLREVAGHMLSPEENLIILEDEKHLFHEILYKIL